MKNILVTGCAGFIGFNLCEKLLKKKIKIIGVDNLNNFYENSLKKKRIKLLCKNKNFSFIKLDISTKKCIKILFKKKFDHIFHLAAQAGVRQSLTNPRIYLESNIIGFFNILELSKLKKINHLIYASSSSVYGSQNKKKYSESLNTDKPLQFYAATKKSNEVMGYSYAINYKIPMTCCRFFTVYGPHGRPDMATFKFTNAIVNQKNIHIYNKGNHKRDFTYVDDVVECLFKLLNKPPKKNYHQIVNLGKGRGTDIVTFLKIIEKNLKKTTKVKFISKQQGDMIETLSSIKKLKSIIGFSPKISPEKGIKLFIDWYKSFYESKK